MTRRPRRTKPAPPPKAPGPWRDRIAALLAVAAVAGLGSAFVFSKGTHLLMPGPLTSGHAAIEKCSTCHTQNGNGKLSWIHGLVAADPLADSKACLSCHRMSEAAFNPHGASSDVLNQSTSRLTKIAASTTPPLSARAQNAAFPMHDVVAGGLFCATCHQEHQGTSFNLTRVSNEQCRSCHVVKFDSFDGAHPNFETYPFERRTRIVYDHAAHFDKHFPETAKKDPARRIPSTCATCHNSGANRQVMAVAPFDQTCTGCHLDQIVGKERASGPKGIAFLSLPGLDLQTLKERKAAIGEWPEASDAALTPFMKVMIGRNERGRALIKAVDGLNLQDLAQANDEQIRAVADLAQEIKRLFHVLTEGKASDALGNLTVGDGRKPSASLIADLTASLPRDVVKGAQLEWLPNLAAETTNGPATGDGASPAPVEESASPVAPQPAETASAEVTAESVPEEAAADAAQPTDCVDEQPRTIEAEVEEAAQDAQSDGTAGAAASPEVDEESLSAEDNGDAVEGRLPLPTGTPRAIKARAEDAETTDEADVAAPKSEGSQIACADQAPSAEQAVPAAAAAGAKANPDGGGEAAGAEQPPQGQTSDQVDDLLFPTAEELAASKAGIPDSGAAAKPEVAAKAEPAAGAAKTAASPESEPAAEPQSQAASAVSFESGVDAESWAEYGGWYRQDYAIYYRPTGHKDKFIHAWLGLTGPQAPKGGKSPATAVFDSLTGKDAQGSCTKCHSVDDVRGKGRFVNFLPISVEKKRGRFTNFVHEPHFGIMDNRGCLTCHELEKNRPYLQSYEQGNPRRFVSGFGPVKKELCQTCHASGMARQDCLLCHKYHVNGTTMPITNTQNLAQ